MTGMVQQTCIPPQAAGQAGVCPAVMWKGPVHLFAHGHIGMRFAKKNTFLIKLGNEMLSLRKTD